MFYQFHMRAFSWHCTGYLITTGSISTCGQGNTLNTLRSKQNGRHFLDDIFNYIFLNECVWISIKRSLKFVSKSLINYTSALVETMARRPGDKPLSEPMMINLLTHICVTRPQWVEKKHVCSLFKNNTYLADSSSKRCQLEVAIC